ncbi:MAG: SDR family NAD(P)-dependent oxidoreductase [Ignavibacteriales bacterium]|nr:SDR family NAD(P)-dependent oxidoreductase [Ignavibacteriales bacterium]
MNKTDAIWITGASSGIGKSLAIKFSENNYKVIGTARRIENINDLNSSNSLNVVSYKNDISKIEEISQFYSEIKKNYSITCLINNAGITSFKPFKDNTVNEIESIIDTNLKGSIYSVKTVLPEMIVRKSGLIINILSVAANTVFTNSSIYAASKAGLAAFAKVLREELREYNIPVINIYPGATSTEIWPEKTIEKFSHRMMNSTKLADLIFDIYKNSTNLSPEEIVVRPITGDL